VDIDQHSSPTAHDTFSTEATMSTYTPGVLGTISIPNQFGIAPMLSFWTRLSCTNNLHITFKTTPLLLTWWTLHQHYPWCWWPYL